MALRLTDASPDPDRPSGLRLTGAPGAASTALPDDQAPHALRSRAAALLVQRDLDGYAALWSEAADIKDVHRRYQAQCFLAEAGLAHRDASWQFVSGMFATIALRNIELLEKEPREPRLLNFAGIALYELGELAAAEALFNAAFAMMPELTGVAGNRKEIQRRRKAGFKPPKLPAPVLAAMRELGPRGKRAAAKAKPATGLTMSLCMIVKDEEEMLPQCLEAVRDAVDEMIVVDTGSTDRTVEIAEEFGAKVLHHAWDGSFSTARNVSFDAATSDWILYLDADEVLVGEDVGRLKALTGRVWRESFYLIETNYTGAVEDGTSVNHNALRVFRNRPEYRFSGRIHEQIAQHLPGFLPERQEVTDVRVEHYGYLGVVRDAKEKSRRNLDLLLRQSEEGVDTAFHHYNLGSEYSGAGEFVKSLEEFQITWDKLQDDPELLSYGFVPSFMSRYVQSLRVNLRFEDCVARGDDVLELLPGFTDVVLEQAHATRALGDLAGAEAKLRLCIEMGDAPSNYSATVGCGTYIAQTSLADLLRAKGDLAEAERVLLEVRNAYPQFLSAVEPLADLMAARGAEADEIVAAVEADSDLSAAARFMLAVPLHERGATEQAEAQLRKALAAQPDNPPIRLALSEALLSQGLLSETVEVVEPLGPDSDWGVNAARTACFALLADEERDVPGAELDAALARAREAGMSEPDLQVLTAWRGRRDGVAVPPSMPAAAAAGALTMLEALLRLEAFDRFAELLPIVETLALPWRERHEQLAAMYLRRGFLESAADEWVAVVEEAGADVPALLGLAQVAAMRGMKEDAEVLANEVKKLEPANPVADKILELIAA
ncbi:MAG: glycosyltransferase [Solirubrobacteraceae bacterium]|nr:glycosyltransferase [Solirubrobacteraceae bacterium]